jgi:hypothetical protein
MEFSPRRSLSHRKLYRNRMFAVTLAASFCLVNVGLMAQEPMQRYGHKAAADKGPRALGLVQISPKGKARLTPIVVMMDGKFFDAGSYKAAPVPMALDFGIVYEGFRAGVSQGIFTITQPGQLNHTWIAEGTWLPAGTKAAEKNKKYSTPVIEDKDAPPVLHRRGKPDSDNGSDKTDKDKADKDKDKKDEQKAATPPAAVPASGAPTTRASTTSPPTSAPTPPPVVDTTKTPAPAETAKPSASDEPNADPNRPRLRRGKPDASEHHDPFTTFDTLTDVAPGPASATAKPGAAAKGSVAPSLIVVVPAISDVGGPDPRPYTYDVKPAEAAIYRNKMLDLATMLLHVPAAATAKAKETATSHKTSSAATRTAKPSKPDFDDVNLRIFDLSNSNEPVLVLSAKIHPPGASPTGNVEEPKEIMLIARTNLEGELKKLFFSQTDSQHLDVFPHMDLIDAVDADGDGRGELLFRRTFDGGSAYAIYRVTADQLWPLFEGTP